MVRHFKPQFLAMVLFFKFSENFCNYYCVYLIHCYRFTLILLPCNKSPILCEMLKAYLISTYRFSYSCLKSSVLDAGLKSLSLMCQKKGLQRNRIILYRLPIKQVTTLRDLASKICFYVRNSICVDTLLPDCRFELRELRKKITTSIPAIL